MSSRPKSNLLGQLQAAPVDISAALPATTVTTVGNVVSLAGFAQVPAGVRKVRVMLRVQHNGSSSPEIRGRTIGDTTDDESRTLVGVSSSYLAQIMRELEIELSPESDPNPRSFELWSVASWTAATNGFQLYLMETWKGGETG